MAFSGNVADGLHAAFRGAFRPFSRSVLVVALTAAAVGPAAAQDKSKLPAREDVTLTTSDDMLIKATYWPPREAKKESVPVILLHAFKGSRHDFSTLGEFLQEHGFAVLAPDFRGHGDSRRMGDSNRVLQATDMPPAAFTAMIEDVEACKRFMMGKNNSGDVNIDKLCIVGAEMGGIVAANWAIVDWDWEPLAVGKQGQDVKALVLLSPPERFKSLRMVEPLAHRAVRSRISVYVAVGKEDPTAVRDASKIYHTLKKFHAEPSGQEAADLYYDDRFRTPLQGTKLLGKDFSDQHLAANIVEFLDARARSQPFVWKDRKLP